jgi:hypothetical protein
MSTFMASVHVQDSGPTVRELLTDIPHDGPAIVVYVMIALFIGFIWWGSRRTSRGEAADAPADETNRSPESPETHD